MAIDRRTLLAGLGASALAPPLPVLAEEDPALYIACAEQNGDHKAVLFNETGAVHKQVSLPGRGHGFALSPTGRFTEPENRAVIFARRPKDFAIVIDSASGRVLATLKAPEGRHFYGHGCFEQFGRLLYTTENDYGGERGIMGIWEMSGRYRRLGERAVPGIGPHDIQRMPGSDTLAVAIGGIATHPETGRTKLNVPDMEPSLALIEGRTGERYAQCRLPRELHKLSIRHLAVTAKRVVAAMQYEGAADDTPPLLFTWDGGDPVLLTAPADIQKRMKNYCGSVALDRSGKIIAASHPRGNLITFWDAAEGKLIHTQDVEDGCGLSPAPAPHRFLITSGTGERLICDPVAKTAAALSEQSGMHWDNHAAGFHT